MPPSDEPIALEAYEALAEAYAAIAENKAENGYNEHPAMRKAIGDVAGLRVLDAGCGPGFLSRDLLLAGAAAVTGFDVSPKMVAIAQRTAGPNAQLFEHDMAKPLDGLADQSFDRVVSSLAIDYVRDWTVPLAEFHRLLSPGGQLIASVQHPMGAFQWFKPPTAFGVHLCQADWRGFTETPVTVPDYYRSMSEILNPILDAGFRLDRLEETQPIDELAPINPRKYAQGKRFPTFMILKASKA